MNSNTAFYLIEAIRQIERNALATMPAGVLMQRAGQAAANAAMKLLPADLSLSRVLVLAGPGNNGGDALVAATCLARAGIDITVLFETIHTRLPPDAQAAMNDACKSSVRIEDFSFLKRADGSQWALVIDGLFGIGLNKSIASPYREAIDTVNEFNCPILALDVPSGLDADTGNIIGNEGVAVMAAHTITFIGDKPGLHTGGGKDYAGIVQVDDLDIDAAFFTPADLYKNDVSLFSPLLKKRLHNSHKGSYGDVTVIGGASGMQGAAILAGRTALKAGAGRVLIGFIDAPPSFDSMQPELMCRDARQLDFDKGTLVAGPGMGQSTLALDILACAIDSPMALVLDADGLNNLAAHASLHRQFCVRTRPSLITPHPLEAARLLSVSSVDIQSDRLSAAKELARRFHAVTILKGSGTVLAHPDGKTVINLTGNPGLATGGTGDVLAGLCGALLAQHFPAWEAALAAVWIHGKAADLLVDQGYGPVGLTAGELAPCIRTILNQLIAQAGNQHERTASTRSSIQQ